MFVKLVKYNFATNISFGRDYFVEKVFIYFIINAGPNLLLQKLISNKPEPKFQLKLFTLRKSKWKITRMNPFGIATFFRIASFK